MSHLGSGNTVATSSGISFGGIHSTRSLRHNPVEVVDPLCDERESGGAVIDLALAGAARPLGHGGRALHFRFFAAVSTSIRRSRCSNGPSFLVRRRSVVILVDNMAHNSSKPSARNSKPAHPSMLDSEAWKVHPSGETTADEGLNAEIERKRKVEENAPLKGRPAKKV
jgi:hypothetical protein